MDIKRIIVLLSALVCLVSCGPRVIEVRTPARPAGQQDAIGLTADPIDTIHVGFVGVGDRGREAVRRYPYIPWAKVTAVCDLVQSNLDTCQAILAKAGRPAADEYIGEDAYKQLCERDDIDVVYIATDWIHHVPIALYAMDCGKHVAIEVPSAHTLKDIWALIDKCEQTRLHCVMLENCCYDFFELQCLTMAQNGVFGEIEHVEGGYIHNLGPYKPKNTKAWRVDFNQKHGGDVYPTHGLGPLCQVLNIHRGDSFNTLVAVQTSAINGKKIYGEVMGRETEDFASGDQTTTLITTKLGKTILLEHDVFTPRPYDRRYQLVGTLGYADKYPVETFYLNPSQVDSVYWTDEGPKRAFKLDEKAMEQMKEKYRNPILTPELEELAKQVGGHGGMDFIMDYRLCYCLRYGLPLDMDVYDLAEWCCITELGELSIKNNSAPVRIPDFTRGSQDKIKGFSYAFKD